MAGSFPRQLCRMERCSSMDRGRSPRPRLRRNDVLRRTGMQLKLLWCAALLSMAPAMVHAQSAANPPDLTGVWGIYRGGPGSDPKFRPPAPTPLVLRPEYDKPYQARRAEEAAAAKRGEQLANAGAECIPY